MTDAITDAALADLDAKYEAMTPGEWAEDGRCIHRAGDDVGAPMSADRGMTDGNRRGIVAIHNSYPALRQRIADLTREAAQHRTYANDIEGVLEVIAEELTGETETAGLVHRVKECKAELDSARDTNTRLHKRCQSAEAALTDANNVINEMARNTEKGTPWVGGNLGRALLAHRVSQLEGEIAEAREAMRAVLGREPCPCLYAGVPGRDCQRCSGTGTRDIIDGLTLREAVERLVKQLADYDRAAVYMFREKPGERCGQFTRTTDAPR